MGVRNAQVILIDSLGNSQTVMTTAFGYFRFANVQVGETYVVLVRSKRFRFAPQIVNVTEDIGNLNFTASETSGTAAILSGGDDITVLKSPRLTR